MHATNAPSLAALAMERPPTYAQTTGRLHPRLASMGALPVDANVSFANANRKQSLFSAALSKKCNARSPADESSKKEPLQPSMVWRRLSCIEVSPI